MCFFLTFQYLPCRWGVTALIIEQEGPQAEGVYFKSRGHEGQQLGSSRVEKTQLSHWPSSFGGTAHLRLISGGPGEQASVPLLQCVSLRKQEGHGPWYW